MKCVLLDIDGTLADCSHRTHHLPNWDKFFSEMDKDPVIEPVAATLRAFYHSPDGYKVLIVSARPDDYRHITVKWLAHNHLPYHKLYMRKSGDFRKDAVVKAEILQQILDDGYEPHLVVDDRQQVVEMWRAHGICTLQCAPNDVLQKHQGKQFLDLMVGPSGAGKSTYIAKNYGPEYQVISTDELRAKFGWGHTPEDLNKTWSLAHSLLKTYLENHIPTVFDATNIKRKDRLALMKHVPAGQHVRYVVIDRDLDDKLAKRDWRPENLVLRHHNTFQSQLKDILAGDNLPNVVVLDKRS